LYLIDTIFSTKHQEKYINSPADLPERRCSNIKDNPLPYGLIHIMYSDTRSVAPNHIHGQANSAPGPHPEPADAVGYSAYIELERVA
jgi:hypothetical protein